MKYNPDIHHRRSIRLSGYDYSSPGLYYVTLCVQNRECLFGEIQDREILLNEAGSMIKETWTSLPNHYPGINIDLFVVMPNHFHGVVEISAFPVGATPCGCPPPEEGRHGGQVGRHRGLPLRENTNPLSLPDVIHRFKTMTTKTYTDGVMERGWHPFSGRLWQRNYYEYIVRDDDDLSRIREYIVNNAAFWEYNQDNPARWADGIPPKRRSDWQS